MRPTVLRLLAALLLAASPSRADVPEVRFAQQFSMGYLQFNVMNHLNFLPKHAADTKGKIDIDLMVGLLQDPRYQYILTPSSMTKWSDFMFKMGWMGVDPSAQTAFRCTNPLISSSARTESGDVGFPGINACGWPGKLSYVTFPPAAA